MGEIDLFGYGYDARRILATSLELIEQGRPEFYRVAALELRLLLCDTTRRTSSRRVIVPPGLRGIGSASHASSASGSNLASNSPCSLMR